MVARWQHVHSTYLRPIYPLPVRNILVPILQSYQSVFQNFKVRRRQPPPIWWKKPLLTAVPHHWHHSIKEMLVHIIWEIFLKRFILASLLSGGTTVTQKISELGYLTVWWPGRLKDNFEKPSGFVTSQYCTTSYCGGDVIVKQVIVEVRFRQDGCADHPR